MYEVKMPKLGMAQSWCVVEKWYKKPGDEVKKGDLVVEVSTDKISYEVESIEDGILLKILKNEGEEAPVGEIIALIGSISELDEIKDIDTTNSIKTSEKNSSQANVLKANITFENKYSNDYSNIKISALAKNIVEANNIDILKVRGTGPGGRILKEDVDAYIKVLAEENKSDAAIKDVISDNTKKEVIGEIRALDIKIHSSENLSSIRKIIADKMTFSKQNIPHISQTAKADVSKLVAEREILREKNENLSFTDFFIKAAAMALKDNLRINSSFINGRHITYEDINIGLVTIIPGGLVIPVIKNCDKKTVADISATRRELSKKIIENKLGLEDISGGTFTISNLGTYNIKSFSAIIYPPQGAILSIGAIYENPEAINGRVEIRKVVELTSAQDHRIIDGAEGAKFLTDMVRFLENPETLLHG